MPVAYGTDCLWVIGARAPDYVFEFPRSSPPTFSTALVGVPNENPPQKALVQSARYVLGSIRSPLLVSGSGSEWGRWHNLVDRAVAYVVDEAGDDQLVWRSRGVTESFDVVLH